MNPQNPQNFVQINAMMPEMNMNMNQFGNMNFEEGGPSFNFSTNMQGNNNSLLMENFLKNNNNNQHGNFFPNKEIFGLNFVNKFNKHILIFFAFYRIKKTNKCLQMSFFPIKISQVRTI